MSEAIYVEVKKEQIPLSAEMKDAMISEMADMLEMLENNAERRKDGIWTTVFNDNGMGYLKILLKEVRGFYHEST